MTSTKTPNSPGDDHASTARPSFHQGFAFGTISFLIGGALAFVTGIVTARLYGIHVVGEFALVCAPTGAVWYLSTAREQPALVKTLAPLRPRDPLVTGLFTAIFAFSTALTAVVVGIVAVVTWVLFHGPIFHPHLFLPTVAGAWSDTWCSPTRDGTSTRCCRHSDGPPALLGPPAPGARLPAACGARKLPAPRRMGPRLALVGSYATSLAHRVFVARHWIGVPVPRAVIRTGFCELPAMLRFGLKVTPVRLANGTATKPARGSSGAVSSVATVGAYNRAWSMSQRLVEVNYRITEMLFPTLVERHNAQDHEGFDRALVDSIRYVAIGLLLPAAAAGGAAKGIMSLYGPGFEQGSTALAVLLIFPSLLTAVSMQTQALLAVNRPLATTAVSLARAAVTLGGGIALSLWLGMSGMAIAMVLGGVTQFILQHRTTRSHIITPLLDLWPARQMTGLILAYVAGFAASSVLDGLITEPGVWSSAWPAAPLHIARP